ncbi:MAG: hypothetical protein KUA35_07785 [Pseudodesulfovibrio sp.]|uniref:Uncharacterized protein n=1 Tax=Pseudodesulfovibrio aespoeensis (strain ATCC 700646 / DSM 10631 / Aspo-2) TaxID=643562 RepID=E6VSL2_PSEA9|nr:MULTISPECIES: hypothetical protein [Pseudodesulfovibrio]MBU4380060.1 hypothetical protein [Pseudomonadota bacterium]ADU61997.1 hypothetical protein Daes_0981 [Pseudodesulfovibrio aespoeensis Aspo-2]MBU4516033.1 hypothetical protein [Pseudomonadota bacterium]MBU4522765.1 hypothetical protein [Pseudomonadota bacterium]MBU4559889.1 hypothetical protein [Pseudomonadota bacterium]
MHSIYSCTVQHDVQGRSIRWTYAHDKQGMRILWNNGGNYTRYEYAPDHRLLRATREWNNRHFRQFLGGWPEIVESHCPLGGKINRGHLFMWPARCTR